MNLRERVLRGSVLLLAGQVAGQGLAFVRNVVVARLISPDDFGIAATFAMTLSLLEMMSDLAADRLLIQAVDGDDPALQATAHTMQLARGALSSALIFLFAWPVARLFGVPEALWAFQWLAVVPLLRAGLHLDFKRVQRQMRYGPSVVMEAASQAAALALAWPLALWTRDYAAVLWASIFQVLIMLVLSHALAQRPYRAGWSAAHARRILAFGWPLLVNGLLLFGIFQGDRLVVGTHYSMAALGVYAVAFSLTMLPTLMIARINAALMLPMLAESQGDRPQFLRRYRMAAEALALKGGILAVTFILLGGPLVRLLYGEAYAEAGSLIGILGAMQAIRLIRAVPSQAAMALGETQNTMIANVVRSAALVGMFVVAAAELPLAAIAACGLAGEVLALGTAAGLLRWRHGLPLRLLAAPLGMSAAGASAAAVGVEFTMPASPVMAAAVAAATVLLMLLYASFQFLFQPMQLLEPLRHRLSRS